MFGVGCRFETHPFVRREGHGVADACLTEMQLTLDPVGAAGQDHATVEPGQEDRGFIDPVHQAVPHLLAAEGFDERIERVVDLDEVFETQGSLRK